VSPSGRAHSGETYSVVKRRSDLPLSSGGVVVLDPQLRVVRFHELFDLLAAPGVCSLSGSVVGTFFNVSSSG
jgi:hypothetical protein